VELTPGDYIGERLILMAETFQLEIVTPEKMVVKDTAEEMQIPGKNGYLGILPGHAPLISELAVGEISYRSGSETHYLCVAWGFAEVLPDKVTILAETAERGEEVDCERAQKAKERAEKRLTSADPEVDVERAQNALARANSRLEAAAREGRGTVSH
jgi:F-type H+-transporting ATPase subunit epsilon